MSVMVAVNSAPPHYPACGPESGSQALCRAQRHSSALSASQRLSAALAENVPLGQ